MVRGLDYYNRTTFELLSGDLGAQNAVAAGGRYDGLVETLGGPATPALGFALGMERLALLLGGEAKARPGPAVFLIYRGEAALEEALRMRRELLGRGLYADLDYEDRSFKAQMRAADRKGARLALILGEDEMSQGTATLKDLAAGTQETLSRDEAILRVLRTVHWEANSGA
jgi:histidyl-tRNA synthetase